MTDGASSAAILKSSIIRFSDDPTYFESRSPLPNWKKFLQPVLLAAALANIDFPVPGGLKINITLLLS